MLALVLAAVLLHTLGLAAEPLSQTSAQLMVLGRGEFLAVLFAALLGALTITSEIATERSSRRSWSARGAAVSSWPRSG